MNFKYKLNPSFPPMAWIAECTNEIVKVTHGNNVETKDDFFVEGAWNGEFSKGDFIESDWFCGSGAVKKENSIVFSTPSHVTSALYCGNNAEGGGTMYLTRCTCC